MWPVSFLDVFILSAVVLEVLHASVPIVFAAAALGVVPTAALMARRSSTSRPASSTSPSERAGANDRILRPARGAQEVVKASLIG
jgi:hypothetical protein